MKWMERVPWNWSKKQLQQIQSSPSLTSFHHLEAWRGDVSPRCTPRRLWYAIPAGGDDHGMTLKGPWMEPFFLGFCFDWFTPWKFNSSPLKMDGWKMSFLLGFPIFRGYVKDFGGVVFVWWFCRVFCFVFFSIPSWIGCLVKNGGWKLEHYLPIWEGRCWWCMVMIWCIAVCLVCSAPWKINMDHNHGGLVQIIFLCKWGDL